jgi:hypothetical protein
MKYTLVLLALVVCLVGCGVNSGNLSAPDLVWGPYEETLGGQLPPNLQTLVISYRYTCDTTTPTAQIRRSSTLRSRTA